MKKAILAMLLAVMLVAPLGGTVLAVYQGTAGVQEAVYGYVPGDVPAETTAAESMLPAIHGLVLAILGHDTDRFDPVDGHLAWEGL